MLEKFILALLIVCGGLVTAQHNTSMVARLHHKTNTIAIEQELTIVNTSSSQWNNIILLDWANAFSSKNTALAARFAEDFKNKFEFSSDERKGGTSFLPSAMSTGGFEIERLPNSPDIVNLKLDEPLLPGSRRVFNLTYTVTIPDATFTDYGWDSTGNYSIKYWYLHPAPYYDGKWQYYSHKMLNDFHGSAMDMKVSLHVDSQFKAISSLSTTLKTEVDGKRSYLFEGENAREARLQIFKDESLFETLNVTSLNLVTDIKDSNLNFETKLIFLDRIATFLEDKLGTKPDEKMFFSEAYYRENPVYGLSSLPSFINPYPAGFTYEVKMLKTIARKWVESGINVNPRKEGWIQQSIMVYLMMQYIDQYYPELKISGKLSNIWGIRGFNLSQLKMNDQFPLIYMNSVRLNLDQAITTPVDSLVKINEQLAIPYKGAIGLRYLNDYLDDNTLEKTLRDLYDASGRKLVDERSFNEQIISYTDKDVSWFFDTYIDSHKRMDWKLKNVKKTADSVRFTIKNKSETILPVPVYLLENDSIISKQYINNVVGDTTITLSRKRANRIALNYERIIPEFNPRDNYKTLKGGLSLNRPLEFRLIKDVEDPEKSQIFLIPDIEFNIYDGLAIGSRFYNKNILRKPFNYSIKPAYGFGSGKIVGGASFSYSHPLQNRENRLYQVTYGMSGNRFSYADDLMFRRASAFLGFSYRPKDLRSNRRQSLSFRNIFIDRDRDPSTIVEEPDYNVFAISFTDSDPNFRRLFTYNIGAEISPNFTKADFTIEWRKLFKDSRQLNVRFFVGAFLYNGTNQNGDFFSFALDRPTDYLFDYNYYGRSEDDGLFSQQLIIAEGGFKSQLEPAFANQWITTVNTSYSIWKYVFAYGDIGLVDNRDQKPQFVYDSGIRLNLLQDYFELYFPIYSNNGWEIAQDNYDEKIRFIVSLDINTFVKLFQRRWY
ncbi:MAG: aminopeptidase [Nonlabens sp.]